MFELKTPIAIAFVSRFVSDEVHITGKARGNPMAVLSFLAVDDNGKPVPNAPVPVVKLTGEAFNRFYAGWQSETDLYRLALALALENVSGCEVSGVDLAKVAGVLTATEAEEILA